MTLPFGESTDRVHDIIVVGAGPAGSLTALGLAARGASVLLVDRSSFPRPKVCGCCVNPRALEALRRAGQGGLTERLGAVPLTGLTLGCDGGRATIRQPLGVAVSRDAFDLALIDAARDQGAAFLPETSAALLPDASPDFRALRLRRGGESWTVRGRFVVSATGLTDSLREEGPVRVAGVGTPPPRLPVKPTAWTSEGGVPTPATQGSIPESPETRATPRPAARSKIGAGAIAPELPLGYTRGMVYMACGREGYVGLVALEDGRLDIAAALKPGAVRQEGGIGPLAERILAGAGFPEVPGLARLSWKGTPGLSRTAPVLARDRVFRVGDAAGYVEPFTGEGMAWALAGGSRLAALLGENRGADHWALERAWAEIYRREVTRTQLVCRAARLALRTPWLTRTLVRVLTVSPRLANPLIRSIHRPRTSTTGP